MIVRGLIVLTAGLSVAAYAPAPPPKEPKNKLEGNWALVSMGKAMTAGQPLKNTGVKAHITGDRWKFILKNEKAEEYELIVDAKAKPPTLDLKRVGAKGAAVLAIYHVEKDTLKIGYYNAGKRTERPKAFDTKDAYLMQMTFQREKR